MDETASVSREDEEQRHHAGGSATPPSRRLLRRPTTAETERIACDCPPEGLSIPVLVPTSRAPPRVFMAFDCMPQRGRDLRDRPLSYRRRALEDTVGDGHHVYPARRLPPCEYQGATSECGGTYGWRDRRGAGNFVAPPRNSRRVSAAHAEPLGNFDAGSGRPENLPDVTTVWSCLREMTSRLVIVPTTLVAPTGFVRWWVILGSMFPALPFDVSCR